MSDQITELLSYRDEYQPAYEALRIYGQAIAAIYPPTYWSTGTVTAKRRSRPRSSDQQSKRR
jgi:hypothetical protein